MATRMSARTLTTPEIIGMSAVAALAAGYAWRHVRAKRDPPSANPMPRALDKTMPTDLTHFYNQGYNTVKFQKPGTDAPPTPTPEDIAVSRARNTTAPGQPSFMQGLDDRNQ